MSVQYTRERLSEAAAQCADIDEVITFFGTSPYGKLRRYLFSRFDHFRIDISHMPRRTPATQEPVKPTADELRRAVKQATSIAGALRAPRLEPYD
jgi:hypothetical protein